MQNDALHEYSLRMGDNCLILAQRISEWVGHAPILEEDIGLANIALDLIGQTRFWLELAGDIEGEGRTADDLAYHRDAGAFRNLLLVEQPNGDFARTIVRQFLFDAWHYHILSALTGSTEQRMAEIAEKAVKEVSYHLTRTTDLTISLGDGTDESRRRMQEAIDDLWPFTGECFMPDPVDEKLHGCGAAPETATIKTQWHAHVSATLDRATLRQPGACYMQKGGKRGTHTEYLGYILAEMQFLQRAYPNASW